MATEDVVKTTEYLTAYLQLYPRMKPPRDQSMPSRLVCPYHAIAPPFHTSCEGADLQSTTEVIWHLRESHRYRFHCEACGHLFKDVDDCEEHYKPYVARAQKHGTEFLPTPCARPKQPVHLLGEAEFAELEGSDARASFAGASRTRRWQNMVVRMVTAIETGEDMHGNQSSDSYDPTGHDADLDGLATRISSIHDFHMLRQKQDCYWASRPSPLLSLWGGSDTEEGLTAAIASRIRSLATGTPVGTPV